MAENTERKTFYDHFAQDKPTKLGTWLVISLSKRIFEFAQLKEGCSVLEIGPGRGVFADICLSKDIDYWAIEPNERMAQALEKRGVNVLRNVVPPIPVLEQSFDVVVMTNVMEHMDTITAALRLSRDIFQLLNPGGRFVICSPDYVNWRHHFFQEDFSHNYVTTWRRLQGLLISAGFESIDGGYQSGPFRGTMCFVISALAALLPFGCLDAVFLKNKLLHKLYKLQITFLRKVLIAGIKRPQ